MGAANHQTEVVVAAHQGQGTLVTAHKYLLKKSSKSR